MSGNKKVLYIEDNPANTQLVRKILKRVPDIQLHDAPDAETGLQMFEAIQPVMVLMDIDLPGMNGDEALQVLKERYGDALVPVVAVSANAMEKDVERGLALGFYAYLTKPINIPEFLEIVNAVVRKS